MPPKSNAIIIADTSCLILLSKIGELELLRLLSNQVYVTSIVKMEFGSELPDWIQIKDPSPNIFQGLLEKEIDQGEISAILLALETPSSLLIIDDQKGRRVAQRLNIKLSGTLGLFLKAKQMGVIKKISPILDKIRMTNFRINDKLFEDLKKAAGE